MVRTAASDFRERNWRSKKLRVSGQCPRGIVFGKVRGPFVGLQHDLAEALRLERSTLVSQPFWAPAHDLQDHPLHLSPGMEYGLQAERRSMQRLDDMRPLSDIPKWGIAPLCRDLAYQKFKVYAVWLTCRSHEDISPSAPRPN